MHLSWVSNEVVIFYRPIWYAIFSHEFGENYLCGGILNS